MGYERGMLASVDKFALPASACAENPARFLDAMADAYGISPEMNAAQALASILVTIADEVCAEVRERTELAGNGD